MTLGERRQTLEPRIEVAMLGRLHQTEMALRQRERLVARDRAEDGNAQGRDGA